MIDYVTSKYGRFLILDLPWRSDEIGIGIGNQEELQEIEV